MLSFDGVNGCYPQSTMIQGTDGSLYGTTESCGGYGGGTAFSLNVGFRPFVETLPYAGVVGQAVRILGNDLIGSTSVSFGGTLASFTVVSNSTNRGNRASGRNQRKRNRHETVRDAV